MPHVLQKRCSMTCLLKVYVPRTSSEASGQHPLQVVPTKDQIADAGETISVQTKLAHTGESRSLVYKLLPGAQPGAAVDAQTGTFTWNIPENTAAGTYEFVIQVASQDKETSTVEATIRVVVDRPLEPAGEG